MAEMVTSSFAPSRKGFRRSPKPRLEFRHRTLRGVDQLQMELEHEAVVFAQLTAQRPRVRSANFSG
jgi:hypothetical protein